MADLGTIGRLGTSKGVGSCSQLRKIALGSTAGRGHSVGVYRENVEGNSAPCLVMDQPAKHRFRWNVGVGTRTIQIDVKQAANSSPYPTLTVKADSSLGVAADAVGTAAAGAGWKTIGPVTVTPSVAGVLWVELECTNNTTFPPPACYWDNLLVG